MGHQEALRDMRTHGISYRDAQLQQYEKEGSFEHEAHAVIQPEFEKALGHHSPEGHVAQVDLPPR